MYEGDLIDVGTTNATGKESMMDGLMDGWTDEKGLPVLRLNATGC